MPLPKDFLSEQARKKDLGTEETKTFLELFGTDKSRIEIAETLIISESALSSRLTEIYKKFSFRQKGPVKAKLLSDYLNDEHLKTLPKKPQDEIKIAITIDTLVQNIRDAMRPAILERCGKMKILDMEQPIRLDDIYTNVNILEKMTRYREIDLIKMMQEASPEEVERFSFGAVKDKPILGLEAVERYNKLMIFGKPGAGKTTFLKHLAMQCIGGEFQAHRIPVFVELNEFAKTEGHPNLTDYIHRIITTCFEVPLKEVFDAGRLLILLDGLDEVNETDISRVLPQIKKFAEQPHSNQYVITCRIAALEFTFDQFFEVEVADFGKDEIKHFSRKFFKIENDEVNSEKFLKKLEDNPTIKELAKSPLLLAMLCYIFKENGELTENRSELYEREIDILLKKWDKKKIDIKRKQIHTGLSIDRKKNILSQIVWQTFESSDYFFKQRDLEGQIRHFFENELQNKVDERDPDFDYEDVLDIIESHHGLLIERANRIYSFSHLTFHEYFAAREIKEKVLFQQLASHITEYRWQGVILLTMEMLPNADDFIYQLKQTTDTLLKDEQELQEILVWANKKTRSIKDLYNPQAIRACYLWLALPFTLDLNCTRTSDFPYNLCLVHVLVRQLAKNLDLDNGFDDVNDPTFFLENDLVFALEFNGGFTFFLNLNLNHTRTLDLVLDHALTVILARALIHGKTRNFDHALIPSIAQELNLSIDFQQQFQNLLIKLLNPDKIDQEIKFEWCKTKCQNHAEQLRALMIHHRGIGRNWCFTSEQLQKLEEYLSANLLLLACLNSDCVITRNVREDIEDTLLLPIAETAKRESGRD